MKKIINYEKDILFKTNIGELSSISLEHDFTVDDGILKGDFLVTGEYKPNELSLNKESFEYRLPLEYELDSNVDIDTLSYDIDDFEYNTNEDCLTVYIDFGVRYEEKKNEPLIPPISEEELNGETNISSTIDDLQYDVREKIQENRDEETLNQEPVDIEETPLEDEEAEEDKDRLDEADKDMLVESLLEGDEYVTYHVHIVREGDTLESISEKYGCSVEIIKEYNQVETLEIKSKLIIPDVKDE